MPDGEDESDNVEYFGRNGSAATAAKVAAAQAHFQLSRRRSISRPAKRSGMMDFEAAAKISGSRFVVLKSELARLERAIGQFMLDLHTNEHGYTEVQPPLLVKDDALYGTEPVAEVRGRSVLRLHARRAATAARLIPTAEVPLTNLVRESILAEDELPLRFTALTPCFRSEAGSAGRDTRGMLRQHQFNKVELVSITTPETLGRRA